MNVLHYSLGFPPFRTGGLTKYCIDLMQGQRELGYTVGMLWPGKLSLLKHGTEIKTNPAFYGIMNYEIINPLPVPLDEGIININSFTAMGDKRVYIDFLKELNPDVIHIHTLMGLHNEFLEAAKELNIKTVFTTHDYFGICPKVTLFRGGHTCEDDNNCEKCVECNRNALPIKKIFLMQSPFYRAMKDSFIIKYLREKHRSKFFNDNYNCLNPQIEKTDRNANDYRRLRAFYIDILNSIDTIHFNSSISKMVFARYIRINDAIELNITHRGIEDHRRKKDFAGKLKITYLSPAKPHKGFDLVKKALDELHAEGIKEFVLNLYDAPAEVSQYMNVNKGGYRYSDLEKILDETDLLIAPSVWYETFGFTVLEALSYGVPVLITYKVGAKDLLDKGRFGIIVNDDYLKIKTCIQNLISDKQLLFTINEAIVNDFIFFDFKDYVKLTGQLLYGK